jgi:hypothetical protein
MQCRAEAFDSVARASTRQSLLDFIQRERVEPYSDGQWKKVFRKGGPLEWYNPPSFTDTFFIEIGTTIERSDWLAMADRQWQLTMAPLLALSDVSGAA